ncbi:MAG: hypothetical protein H6R07_1780 [Proteobacteria bacterium]|nr:hypothetical protein [Pseudomonadota bacterium]
MPFIGTPVILRKAISEVLFSEGVVSDATPKRLDNFSPAGLQNEHCGISSGVNVDFAQRTKDPLLWTQYNEAFNGLVLYNVSCCKKVGPLVICEARTEECHWGTIPLLKHKANSTQWIH